MVAEEGVGAEVVAALAEREAEVVVSAVTVVATSAVNSLRSPYRTRTQPLR